MTSTTDTVRTDDGREPVVWANYRAEAFPGIVADIEVGRPMGPNTIGEALWPVEARLEESRTRVGFSYVAPQAAGR